LTISIWKKLNFYILLSQKKLQLLDSVEQLSFFLSFARTVSSNNKKVSSSFFEQSQFEQFTPTPFEYSWISFDHSLSHYYLKYVKTIITLILFSWNIFSIHCCLLHLVVMFSDLKVRHICAANAKAKANYSGFLIHKSYDRNNLLTPRRCN
jgi:hypothetical protein